MYSTQHSVTLFAMLALTTFALVLASPNYMDLFLYFRDRVEAEEKAVKDMLPRLTYEQKDFIASCAYQLDPVLYSPTIFNTKLNLTQYLPKNLPSESECEFLRNYTLFPANQSEEFVQRQRTYFRYFRSRIHWEDRFKDMHLIHICFRDRFNNQTSGYPYFYGPGCFQLGTTDLPLDKLTSKRAKQETDFEYFVKQRCEFSFFKAVPLCVQYEAMKEQKLVANCLFVKNASYFCKMVKTGPTTRTSQVSQYYGRLHDKYENMRKELAADREQVVRCVVDDPEFRDENCRGITFDKVEPNTWLELRRKEFLDKLLVDVHPQAKAELAARRTTTTSAPPTTATFRKCLLLRDCVRDLATHLGTF